MFFVYIIEKIVTKQLLTFLLSETILFLLYTADIFEIIQTFDFKGYSYAGDIQIVASCSSARFNVLAGRLATWLSFVDAWAQNCLKINQCKIQVLHVGTWQQT